MREMICHFTSLPCCHFLAVVSEIPSTGYRGKGRHDQINQPLKGGGPPVSPLAVPSKGAPFVNFAKRFKDNPHATQMRLRGLVFFVVSEFAIQTLSN